MTRNRMAFAAALMVVLLAAAALVAGASAPGDIRLPVHWGLSGTPDRYAGKWEALLLPAAIAAGLSCLFYFLPSLEPRERNLSRSQGLYLWAWAALLLVMAAVEAATISIALGWNWRIHHVMMAAVGVMFVMVGNQLGKSRSMYLIGIRTPWTLASEEVWIRTHRLAGKLMVAGGLLIALCALLPIPSGLLATVFAGAVAVMVGVPVVYSYLLWQRERARRGPD